MTRQVRAEAVFETSRALAAMTGYNAAIQQVISSHNQLNAAMRANQQAVVLQAAAVQGAGQTAINSARAQVQSVQAVSAAYAQLAVQAAAAAAQIRNTNNQRPPQRSNQGGGGQGGGGGGGISLPTMARVAGFGLFGYGVKQILDGAIELSDKWVDINGRIRIATSGAQEFEQTQKSLFDIAQRSRTEYSVVADQFSRLAIAGKGLGLSNPQAVALVDIITDAGRAAHRSASEIRSFATQFPQALATGKVAGDEFRSMLESYPQLIDVVSRNWKKQNGELGITRGELQKLSRDQKLWADEFVNSLFRGRDELRKMAEQAPRTFEQAMVQMRNAWLKSVGEMAESSGFTTRMTAALDKLIEAANGPGGLALIEATLKAIVNGFETLTSAVTSGALIATLIAIREQIYGIGRAFDVLGVAYAKGGMVGLLWNADTVGSIMKIEMENAKLAALTHIKEYQRQMALRPVVAPKGSIAQTEPGEFKQTSRPEDKQLENMRERAKETIKLLEQQINLELVKRSGNAQALTEANTALEIERAITQSMREKVPADAARIEALIRQKELIETAREIEKKEAPAREKIAQIEQETRVRQAQIAGNERLIENAKLQLELEKLITEELRRQNPELARQLETAERIKAIQERMAKDAQQWTSLYERMGNTLVDSMIAAGKEGRSFTDGLRDAGAQFADMLMRAIVFEPIIKAISASMGQMTGGLFGGGPGSMVTGLLQSAAGSAAGTYIGGGASFGGWETYAMPAMARGGVMSGGRITAYANGGVVSSPTMFQHAGGMGLMGESGDEAIMPLFRGPNGKLGVRTEGAGASAPQVNNISIKVDGDMTDATRQRLMADMERLLDRRAPGIVKDSVSAVQKKHQSSPGYLRR